MADVPRRLAWRVDGADGRDLDSATVLRTVRRPAAWLGRSGANGRPSARSGAYVIARFALAATMRSRLFVAFLVACLVPSLVLLVAVYLRYNVAAIGGSGNGDRQRRWTSMRGFSRPRSTLPRW